MITAEAVTLLCSACGHTATLTGPHWRTLTELAAAAEHGPCDRPAVGVSSAPERIRRFVAERMEVAPGAHVATDDVRRAYDDWPGNEGRYSDGSTFGRWFRQVMPAGVHVQRSRIDDRRENWIMGMRLKE